MSVRSLKLNKTLAAGALVLVGLAGANAANANLITFYGSYSPPPNGPLITYDAADDRGALTCSLSCMGLLSSLTSGIYSANVPNISTADGFSASNADLFFLGNNSLTSETGLVNAVVDPDFLTGTKTDAGGLESFSFSSTAEYILLKIGKSPDMALIWNTSGGAQTYSYRAFSGEGAGLSHYTEFGVTSVPEPGSLLLLGAGLLGLGFTRRRRTPAT